MVAVALLMVGLAALVRHGRAQPAELSAFEQEKMTDFKKPAAAELKKKLDQLNSASAQATPNDDKSNVAEPPEIRQLRVQIHQYGDAIAQASRDRFFLCIEARDPRFDREKTRRFLEAQQPRGIFEVPP